MRKSSTTRQAVDGVMMSCKFTANYAVTSGDAAVDDYRSWTMGMTRPEKTATAVYTGKGTADRDDRCRKCWQQQRPTAIVTLPFTPSKI